MGWDETLEKWRKKARDSGAAVASPPPATLPSEPIATPQASDEKWVATLEKWRNKAKEASVGQQVQARPIAAALDSFDDSPEQSSPIRDIDPGQDFQGILKEPADPPLYVDTADNAKVRFLFGMAQRAAEKDIEPNIAKLSAGDVKAIRYLTPIHKLAIQIVNDDKLDVAHDNRGTVARAYAEQVSDEDMPALFMAIENIAKKSGGQQELTFKGRAKEFLVGGFRDIKNIPESISHWFQDEPGQRKRQEMIASAIEKGDPRSGRDMTPFQNALLEVARMLPAMATTQVVGGGVGQLGKSVFGLGKNVGANIGQTVMWGGIMMDDAYGEMVASGVPESKAKWLAPFSAVVEGAIETLQKNPLFKESGSVVRGTWYSTLASAVAERGKALVTEDLEEFLQQVVRGTVTQLSKEGKADLNKPFRDGIEAAKQAIAPLALMMAPGSAINGFKAVLSNSRMANEIGLIIRTPEGAVGFVVAHPEEAKAIAEPETLSRKGLKSAFKDPVLGGLFSTAFSSAEKREALQQFVRGGIESLGGSITKQDTSLSKEAEMPKPWQHSWKGEEPQSVHEEIKAETSRIANRQAYKALDDAVGGIKSQEHLAANMARRTRAALKSEQQRTDITAYMEGTGNVNVEGDTAEDVKARVESNPKAVKIAKELREGYDRVRNDMNAVLEGAGDVLRLAYLTDYVAHFWDLPRRKAAEFLGKWSRSVPNAKERVIPTYEEGVRLGYKPFSTDAAYLFQKYSSSVSQRVYARAFVSDLKKIRLPDESKAITWKETPGYVPIDNPLFRRPKAGSTVWVHPSISRPVRILLERPFTGRIAKAIAAINATGKAIEVGLSAFHEIALFESSQAVSARLTNPLRGYFIGPFEAKKLFGSYRPRLTHRAGLLLDEKDPLGTKDAIMHGFETGRGPSSDFARNTQERGMKWLEEGALPGASHVVRAARRGIEAYNRHLWDNVHTGLKLFGYHTELAEAISKTDMPVDKVKRIVASYINNAFGGQRALQTRFTEKERQVMYGVVFAPDWTLSNIRVAGEALTGIANPVKRRLYARYWRNMAISQLAHMAGVQATIHALWGADDPDHKEYPWENEVGKEFNVDITPLRRAINKVIGAENDNRRHYITTGKQAREVVKYFQRFPDGLSDALGGKSSVAIKTFFIWSSTHPAGTREHPWPWSPTPFREGVTGMKNVGMKTKETAKQALPFSFKGGSFAFSVPESRGMDQYKGARYFNAAIKSYADPSWIKRIKGKVTEEDRTFAAAQAMAKIDHAMIVNGVDPKSRYEAYKEAVSKVQSAYFNDLLGAIESKDVDKAEHAAIVLMRVGLSVDSFNRRGTNKLEQEKVNVDQLIEAGKRLGIAAEKDNFIVPQWPFGNKVVNDVNSQN